MGGDFSAFDGEVSGIEDLESSSLDLAFDFSDLIGFQSRLKKYSESR
jgi:hypothetical protein